MAEQRFNISFTTANTFDILDLTYRGRIPVTADFISAFNDFVNHFILTNEIYMSFEDIQHMSLFSPVMPTGDRTLLNLLVPLGMARVIVTGHLDKSIGIVCYVTDIPKMVNLNRDTAPLQKNYYEKVLPSDILPYLGYSLSSDKPQFTDKLLGIGIGGAVYLITVWERSVKHLVEELSQYESMKNIQLFLPAFSKSEHIRQLKKRSFSLDALSRIAAITNQSLERVMNFQGFRRVPEPSLTNILLSRCKTRDDIPDQLLTMREEFTKFRESGTKYEEHLLNAQTIGEQMDIIEEYEQTMTSLCSKVKEKRTKILFRLWSIVKEASTIKILTKAIDELITWDMQRQILNRYQGFIDLYRCFADLTTATDQLQNFERVLKVTIPSSEVEKVRGAHSFLAKVK